MVELDKLREAQMYELELLKKFKEICEAEGFKYYLIGGTAIGAIRHHGFIPWDDDIDVALLRDDYDKFIHIAGKYLESGQDVLHHSITPEYTDCTMKLVNKNISFNINTDNSVITQNIWIDIFPLDGTATNRFKQQFHYYRVYFLRMSLAYYYLEKIQYNSERAGWKKSLISLAQHLPVNKLVNPKRIRNKIDRALRKVHVNPSGLIGNYLGAYGQKEILPYYVFGNGCCRVFEDAEFLLPEDIETYLEHIYGDYMQLPPEEKQVPKHSVVEVIVNN